MVVNADFSETPVSLAKHLNDLQGLISDKPTTP
jgi:hypothetical protein